MEASDHHDLWKRWYCLLPFKYALWTQLTWPAHDLNPMFVDVFNHHIHLLLSSCEPQRDCVLRRSKPIRALLRSSITLNKTSIVFSKFIGCGIVTSFRRTRFSILIWPIKFQLSFLWRTSSTQQGRTCSTSWLLPSRRSSSFSSCGTTSSLSRTSGHLQPPLFPDVHFLLHWHPDTCSYFWRLLCPWSTASRLC